MEYYLNEYSLRGQFEDTDDFFKSLREETIPVINRIEKENGSVIIKKDTFWQLEVCNGISILQLPMKKNERSGELYALKRRLVSLIQSQPHWKLCPFAIRNTRTVT